MNFFKTWTRGLRLRMMIVCLIPAMALGLVAYYGVTTARELEDEIHKAYMVRAQLIEQSGTMESSVNGALRMSWTAVCAQDHEERMKAAAKVRHHMEEFDLAKAKYLKLPRSQKMVDMFQPVDEHWDKLKAEMQALLVLVEKNPSNLTAAGSEIIGERLRPSANIVTQTTDEMQETRRKIMEADVEKIQARVSYVIVFLIGLSLIAIVATLIIGISVAARTAKAISQIALNLEGSSEHVSTAASQISAASQELSQATTEQAASLVETAASVEQMNAMVAKNTESAKSTSHISKASQEKAIKGKEAVERMMESMREIDRSNTAVITQVTDSNQQMAEIVQVIREIGSKTKVINDIVFQTKLLSFNASVEAARAGEQGKGFAVVAEEVGNLAQMSGKAASEISDMLNGSIQKVEGIANSTKSNVEQLIVSGKQKVEQGIEIARECGDVLNDIVHDVSNVSSMAVAIADASQEQSTGIDEINKAMNMLDQATQQNASTTEETASAAEKLAQQSYVLRDAVGQLVQTIEGAEAEQAASFAAHSIRERVAVVPARTEKVVSLKSARTTKKKPTAHQPAAQKVAIGDDVVPSRDHSGFQDI